MVLVRMFELGPSDEFYASLRRRGGVVPLLTPMVYGLAFSVRVAGASVYFRARSGLGNVFAVLFGQMAFRRPCRCWPQVLKGVGALVAASRRRLACRV